MKNKTILLLLNTKSETNNDSVKSWLKNSGFKTSEVPNVFRAIEEMSDFTVRCDPEVVLIEAVSQLNDFCLIQKIMQISNDGEVSVFAITDSDKIINHKECFEGSFAQVKKKFISLRPVFAHAKAAA